MSNTSNKSFPAVSSTTLLAIFIAFYLFSWWHLSPLVSRPALEDALNVPSDVSSVVSNPRNRLPSHYRYASACNNGFQQEVVQNMGMEPKVMRVFALKFIQGGYNLIQQGSYRVEMVGLMSLLISRVQHDYKIFGSVGELGVHHGRFTACLFLTARIGEKLIVADVFDQQLKNVDGSGLGNKEAFFAGMSTYGLDESSLHTIFRGSTDEIPFDWSKSSMFEPFRFVSVDAGHTARLTFNDLELAFCNLARGGVVVVDDLFHGHWVGVTEGIIQYFLAGSEEKVFPFLICENKLFMTNDELMHRVFYEGLLADPTTAGLFLKDAKAAFGGSNEFVLNNHKWLLCTAKDLGNGIDDVVKIWQEKIY